MTNTKEPTKEQIQAVGKVLSSARWSLFFSGLKTLGLLFLSNLFCTSLERVLFIDPDPSTLVWFRGFYVITNSIFLMVYFTGKMKERDDIVRLAVKEILKK